MLNTAITMAHQGHSARDIAHVVGKTKDAVVNKLSRAGHPLSGIVRLRRSVEQPRREPQPQQPPVSGPSQSGPVLSASIPVTFEKLEPWHCKWPLGELADPVIFFCGERRVNGSYCQAHSEISRNGTPPTGEEICDETEKSSMTSNADLTGKVYGHLTVLAPSAKRSAKGRLWQCLCACGNIKLYATGSLNAGQVVSCGCLKAKRNQWIYAGGIKVPCALEDLEDLVR